MTTWQDAAARDLFSLGARTALFTRGEGSFLWDVDGKRYLDFLGGIAVNSLGHAHPVFVEAVARQAATLAHVSNFFTTAPQLELAARLKRLAGTGQAGRVFLSNSGAEANETALKLARLHSVRSERMGGPPRPTIVALNGGFHGRTMGTLSITPTPAYREPFHPYLPNVVSVDPDADALAAVLDDTVAAVFVEPIQGEAGVMPLPDGFLARARELTTAAGALLIADEVQTGSGRTGEWFAVQHDGVVPDAITLAKALGGGIPVGATVTFGAASDLFQPGSHNSTFGGNPLASAVANAVLEHIEAEHLLDNVTARGEQVRAIAAGLDGVRSVRGRGLLIGIELDEPIAYAVRERAEEHGLIVSAPRRNVIRVAPAFTIGDDEVRKFGELFAAALAVARKTGARP